MENNQKRENLLNMSLQVTREERKQSPELNVGVWDQGETETFEIILMYHGDLRQQVERAEQESQVDLQYEELLPGYGIMTVPKQWIYQLSNWPQVDYIEKPKHLYGQGITIEQGKMASCLVQLTQREPYLSGEGTLIGIPDSGIDLNSQEFLDEEGNSRIMYVWDQTKNPEPEKGEAPPEGFYGGVEYTGKQIDVMNMQEELSFDRSGHGTGIATIAGGQSGVANKSRFLIVKMGSGNRNGFARTTQLMRAVTWILRKAQQLQMPVAINISYGSTYGSHRGDSLLEQFLNAATDTYRCILCVGSGNEGAGAGHITVDLQETSFFEWNVAPFQSPFSLTIWKNYVDRISMQLQSPEGDLWELELEKEGKWQGQVGRTVILGYIGKPTPYSEMEEIYLEFQGNPYVTEGIWQIQIQKIRVRDGKMQGYLPMAAMLQKGTAFYRSSPGGTITIPATAQKVVTVGAYQVLFREYADFSGRGFAEQGAQKPELVAPGVDIEIPTASGFTQILSGTSYAVPFVVGTCALLMEWGIVRGNDPFLYGEKLKAYLISGTKEMQGENVYPNERVGWGMLCGQSSLPGLLPQLR